MLKIKELYKIIKGNKYLIFFYDNGGNYNYNVNKN